MTTASLLVLTTLMFCSVVSLHAAPRQDCFCIRTTSNMIPARVIQKIEVVPVSGSCRWTEIIVTRKNGSKVCADPNGKWAIDLLSNMLRIMSSGGTTLSSSVSIIN